MSACYASIANFKDCTAGVQSIVFTVAILVGAIWTLFTYTALGTRVRAQRELFEQAIIIITIKAEQVWVPGDDGLFIAAVATLSNTGNRNVYLDFRKSSDPNWSGGPFKISKIGFDDEGWGGPGVDVQEAQFKDISQTYNGTLRLRRGSSQELPLFSKVPSVGLYLLEFASELTTKEAIVDDGVDPAELHSAESNEETPEGSFKSVNWVGSTYVKVTREGQPVTFFRDDLFLAHRAIET